MGLRKSADYFHDILQAVVLSSLRLLRHMHEANGLLCACGGLASLETATQFLQLQFCVGKTNCHPEGAEGSVNGKIRDIYQSVAREESNPIRGCHGQRKCNYPRPLNKSCLRERTFT